MVVCAMLRSFALSCFVYCVRVDWMCRFMLFCAVLAGVKLRCVVLCCLVLGYVIVCWVALRCVVLRCVVLHGAFSYHFVSCRVGLCCNVLLRGELWCVV